MSIPYLMRLTPLDSEGNELADQGMIIVGKDVSPAGLSFFHPKPLEWRRAIITWDLPKVGIYSAEIKLIRCRFTKLGWYESGGRLVRVVQEVSDQLPAEVV